MHNFGLVHIDTNSKYPNLVLMKLSAWIKSKLQPGTYNIDLLKPADILNGYNMFRQYDVLYGACVFSENKHLADALAAKGVSVGGSGTGKYEITLRPDQEHIMPDYSLYGITDTAYGFLTRGCPRHCPFCIVGDKEGLVSRKVADLQEFWNGQKFIKLLDPNLLACTDHMNLLEQLANSGAKVDFTQGLDARKLTRANIDLINNIKIERVHFAWDDPRDRKIPTALKIFLNHTKVKEVKRRTVYVLTNYWSTHEEDLYRVYWLRDNGYDPYVMIYDKPNAPTITRYLQRWVNNKKIFRTVLKFEDYDHTVG